MANLTLKDLPWPKRPHRPDRDAPVPEGKKNQWPRKTAELEQAKRLKALADKSDSDPLEDAALRSMLARFEQALRDGEVPDSLASAERYWDLRTPIIGNLWKLVEEYGPEWVALVTPGYPSVSISVSGFLKPSVSRRLNAFCASSIALSASKS